MPFLLDVVYVLLLIGVSPWLAYRSWTQRKYRDGWAEKFLGRSPLRIGARPCVWFHAVSVGEVLLLRPLVQELQRRRPGWEAVISTTTTDGLRVARQKFPELVTFYAPLDFSWAVRRALARVRPTVLALVELELWPNLVRAAHNAARGWRSSTGGSARSHRGYRKLRGPLGGTFRRLDRVAVQSPEYAARFIDLGVPGERVRVTGSVKYDGLESDRANLRTLKLRRDLGLQPSELVFVAGSTMEGEEAAALAAYRAARVEHPTLRLALVPRHAARFDAVAAWLEADGESVHRRSQGPAAPRAGGKPPVVLIDTIGELGAVWGLADVAFVGGSLFPGRGGQNMMEPAAYGAAVLFGRYTENFREAVEGLLTRDGARRVDTAEELTAALREALDDPEGATNRGAAGRAYVLAQLGAAARTVAELDALVAGVPAGGATISPGGEWRMADD